MPMMLAPSRVAAPQELLITPFPTKTKAASNNHQHIDPSSQIHATDDVSKSDEVGYTREMMQDSIGTDFWSEEAGDTREMMHNSIGADFMETLDSLEPLDFMEASDGGISPTEFQESFPLSRSSSSTSSLSSLFRMDGELL
jgi:hypothetical protein